MSMVINWFRSWCSRAVRGAEKMFEDEEAVGRSTVREYSTGSHTSSRSVRNSVSREKWLEAQMEFPKREVIRRRAIHQRLLGGDNTISDEESEFEPELIKHMTRDLARESSSTQRKEALIFGLNYLFSNAELSGCINDAHNMQKYLTENQDLDAYLLMTDRTQFQPTRDNMIEAAEYMVDRLIASGGVLFVHYSGHGSQTRDRGDEDTAAGQAAETDGLDETLVPLDYKTAGQIVDDELFQIFVRRHSNADVHPADSLTVMISDCCHSGTVLDLPYQYNLDKARNSQVKTTEPQNVRSQNALPKVVMISGCRDNQTSSDVRTSTGESYGALSNALLIVLNGSRHQRGILTYRQLLEELRSQLRNYSQSPVLSSTFPLSLDDPVDW
jgi:hypothetical protein